MGWLKRQSWRPGFKGNKALLGLLPIIALVLVYLLIAADRNTINPAEKITPLPGAMIEAMWSLMLCR